MTALHILVSNAVLVLLAACSPVSQQGALLAQQRHAMSAMTPKAACPITRPPDVAFVPPAPYPRSAPGDDFWYGSADLWTSLPPDGVWSGLPHNPSGYTQKLPWWRDGYVWNEEPAPGLVVTGRRLDAAAPPLNAARATNAFTEEYGSMMLVGVDFPTLGCWEIMGRYGDTRLSYVVWLAP